MRERHGRIRTGPSSESFERASRQTEAHLFVHLPRSQRGEVHVGRDRRHEARRIEEFGSANEVYENPQSDYTKILLEAVPRADF